MANRGLLHEPLFYLGGHRRLVVIHNLEKTNVLMRLDYHFIAAPSIFLVCRKRPLEPHRPDLLDILGQSSRVCDRCLSSCMALA